MTPSATVSSSLLEGLRGRAPEAWARVVHLYYPVVRRWGLRAGLQDEDAADVAQEVFRALAGNVGRFDRDGGRNSFRGWVWGITRRQLLAHRRRHKPQLVGAGGTDAQARFDALPDDTPPDASAADADADRHDLLRRALAQLRAGVESRTWEAFWRTVVEGHAPADVAADLGLSVNAVYVAKARLLRRLRAEYGDLLD
jgi:RNA polymerase sigma-70 factor (ECF subfamily)